MEEDKSQLTLQGDAAADCQREDQRLIPPEDNSEKSEDAIDDQIDVKLIDDAESNSKPLELSSKCENNKEEPNSSIAVTEQPLSEFIVPFQPPGLDMLLDTGQVVIHLGNLRQNVVINESSISRMEVINETRKVLLHVEEDGEDLLSDTAFKYRLYNRNKQEISQVYCPSSSTCICCGASWHCLKRCRFEAIVYTPVGIVAGFVRRSRTKFVQEFEILNPNEEPLLVLRGAPQDLEIYSLDFQNELGRLSVHGWMGIMHEVRRTSNDYGLTFPLDLDVRVKVVLIGAVFAIHWLYSTEGGKIRQATQ